ncbi:MAG: M56 family metallopeptidase [Planctomycetota bacterium]
MSFVNVDHWLLDSLVFGTIILMTGGAIATLCRQPAIQIRVIQWTFIAALLVPVLRQLPLMPRVDIAVPRMPDTVTAERVIGGTADLQNPSATQPLLNTEPLTEERSADLAGAMAADAEPIANHAISGETPDRYTNSEQSSWLPSLSVAARGVYLLGLSWMVLACCRALWGRRRIMASATQAAGHVRKVLDDVAGNVRVDGQVSTRTRLLVSSQIDSPIMWGCFRPTIVVPDSMATKQRESDLRFALAHEWSHVLNADFHSHALGHIARTVLFYQPLCWWLHRRLTLCQDYLADAFAAQQSDHRADYAEFLVAVAR